MSEIEKHSTLSYTAVFIELYSVTHGVRKQLHKLDTISKPYLYLELPLDYLLNEDYDPFLYAMHLVKILNMAD